MVGLYTICVASRPVSVVDEVRDVLAGGERDEAAGAVQGAALHPERLRDEDVRLRPAHVQRDVEGGGGWEGGGAWGTGGKVGWAVSVVGDC